MSRVSSGFVSFSGSVSRRLSNDVELKFNHKGALIGMDD